MLGCGASSSTPPSTPPSTSPGTPPATPPNTYLYVGIGETFPSNPFAPPAGLVAQFRVEDNGTLTALNTASTGGAVPYFAAEVTPSNQYLFFPNGAISEFEIGSDGTLTTTSAPTAAGTSIAFVPGGSLALIATPSDATLNSYILSSSGALTPVSSVATGGYSQYVAVDPSGKFAYVSDTDDGKILEYTISSSGDLAAIGSIATEGYDPLTVVVSPAGFLYCANVNGPGSVAQFSVNASTGALSLVNSYSPGGGPLWISFNPAGTYAYVGSGAEISQFTVDGTTGTLISNGTTPAPTGGILWGAVDPSGRFLFAAGVDGIVSQYLISSEGTLIPNGSVSLGPNMVAETLAFAQR